MTEEWRPVVGFSGYEVSDRGRVLSHRSRGGPRLLAGKINRGGYHMVLLSRGDGTSAMRFVHVLVAEAFIGPRPERNDVRHLDGSKRNDLSNLAYGTRSENVRDCVRHGTHRQASATHCLRDHPFDERNTYIRTNGSRACRRCGVLAQQRYKVRRALRAAQVRAA